MRQVDIVKLFRLQARLPEPYWALHLAYDGGCYNREDLEAIRNAIDAVLKEEAR